MKVLADNGFSLPGSFRVGIFLFMARPTIYSEDILKAAKEYLDLCEDETVQVVSGESEKFTSFKEKTIVKMPTIEGLSIHLGISRETVYQWERDADKAEFSDIINILRAKQVERLINKGLSGDYNPMIAKVLLSKHGYTDKTEVQQSGGLTINWNEERTYETK